MAKPKPRFGREDWIELGLSLLGRHGPEALTLERLTEAADKTRGSFYHHFEDHQAFLAALGAYWLAREIDQKIADIDRQALAGARRETLARHAAGIDHALERELRRLAAKEPVIADVVAQSDERRIAYLVRLFRSELGLAADEALARARVQHAYFVGAQMVFPDADARFRLKLQKTLGATLWRA
jgi:AcrR family transcriptional regulator